MKGFSIFLVYIINENKFVWFPKKKSSKNTIKNQSKNSFPHFDTNESEMSVKLILAVHFLSHPRLWCHNFRTGNSQGLVLTSPFLKYRLVLTGWHG